MSNNFKSIEMLLLEKNIKVEGLISLIFNLFFFFKFPCHPTFLKETENEKILQKDRCFPMLSKQQRIHKCLSEIFLFLKIQDDIL